jgi:2-polyprenyl-3-methyl-5-hydroxy-6-metoxy-1,4-benzoquinol methylase
LFRWIDHAPELRPDPERSIGSASATSSASDLMNESVENAAVSSYFEHFRDDILAIIPPGTKSVLSVGCGAGRTEAELVRRGIAVIGIEINPQAAQMAKKRGITVLEGDATKIDVATGREPFDCILYADMLEHLVDPVSLLRRHTKNLRVGGIVYVTVPNFRNYQVFWELFVKGHVIYEDAGILDRTHLRITTRKMVLEWFRDTGLEPIQSRYIISGRKRRLLSACLLGLAREFIASQVALIGTKRAALVSGEANEGAGKSRVLLRSDPADSRNPLSLKARV